MASKVNFPLAPGESLVDCPYDPAHKIIKDRMLKHLTKCRSNHIKDKKKKGEKVEMMVCKFSSFHHYPKAEIDFHERTCPDQDKVVSHIAYHQSEEFKAKAEAHFASNYESRIKAEAGNDDEDWEKKSKGNAPGYNPQVRLQQGHVIAIVPHDPDKNYMAPSERKAYRKRERLREEEYLRKENESMLYKRPRRVQ